MNTMPRGLRAPVFLIVVAVAAVMADLAATASAQVAPTEWSIPTASSQPANLALDTVGNVWFTEFGANNIGRVNPNGVFSEYGVPTASSQPWGIVVDPSNTVWFTETAGNKIGHQAPGGGPFGQDNVPTANAQPRGLALDSSGNVWFAESNASNIGKFVPSNSQFTEYGIPTSSSQPWGVAVDSSGNIWFTERSSNKIGKMTPGGQFSEFSIPTSNSQPTGIAIDASGNIWFAEYDGSKIGMMNPSGNFTEYATTNQGSRPTWVAVDRMGGVWYVGSNSNSYGRVFNGDVTEYGIPTANSVPMGIVVDGGGSVWITEQSANKIAKVVGIVPVATATPVVPTATPVPPQPTPLPAPHDNRYFTQTNYRIDNDVFWDYFNKRGGINTFGYPVSRTFTLQGFTVQFFQRSIMQLGPDGAARSLNLLDPGLMPYTRINGSTFPAPDPSLAILAPVPGTPDYDTRVQEFIRNYAPDQFDGLSVNFYQAFQNTVKLQDAFPQGSGNPALLPLLNLELWGVPTSRPTYDPNNRNFVYLRFQRGIMHFDATNGATQGLLLADYLKSIITGVNLPGDLDAQAAGSAFYKQYNPNKANWVDRPDQLPATNLSYAFERQ